MTMINASLTQAVAGDTKTLIESSLDGYQPFRGAPQSGNYELTIQSAELTEPKSQDPKVLVSKNLHLVFVITGPAGCSELGKTTKCFHPLAMGDDRDPLVKQKMQPFNGLWYHLHLAAGWPPEQVPKNVRVAPEWFKGKKVFARVEAENFTSLRDQKERTGSGVAYYLTPADYAAAPGVEKAEDRGDAAAVREPTAHAPTGANGPTAPGASEALAAMMAQQQAQAAQQQAQAQAQAQALAQQQAQAQAAQAQQQALLAAQQAQAAQQALAAQAAQAQQAAQAPQATWTAPVSAPVQGFTPPSALAVQPPTGVADPLAAFMQGIVPGAGGPK